jgi:hypothetical protein
MKAVLFSLSIIFLLFSCSVVDAPTAACKWGPILQNCTETTYEDCIKSYKGTWYGQEHCP